MDNLWKKYAGDFNSMTDDEVDDTVSDEQEKLKEAQEWLDAVASWKAAGKPRRTPMNKPNHVPPGDAAPRHIGYDLREIGVLEGVRRDAARDREQKKNFIAAADEAYEKMQQTQPHNWTVPVLIALIIVALLMLGLSLDVQATVDAVNMEMTNETD
jgi:hypothetical protein